MQNTQAQEVIDFFESSFAERQIIPDSLEKILLRRAVGRYSTEIDPLHYDEMLAQFDTKLDDYVIGTLAQFMLQMYQERQVSLVNKRVSIVGKDISIDGSNGTKTAEKAHLEHIVSETDKMVEHQKPSAYS